MNPYLLSEQAFNSPEGKAQVAESLKELTGRIKKAPEEIKSTPGFRITYSLLTDHIRKTEEVFKKGEMEYARMRLNGMGNLCAGCHMQAPKVSRFSSFEFVVERGRQVNFENAEFLFVIRRYDEALPLFDKLVREYPKNGLASDRLNEVYRRKLAMFARVYQNPDMAISNLKEDLKNAELPVDVRRNVESWIAALEKWKKEKVDPAKMKSPELVAYVAKKLPGSMVRKIAPESPDLFDLLRLSGLLYARLYNEKASPQTQEMLYYLAQIERSLSPLYWYSVSEVYLKECVVQYPKKTFSKKCYDAYREGMEERYAGKDIPEGVRQSIEALKDYL
ncbi:MAG: hypothetical protein HC902_03520 [Calothrix sp. SM1_5_4]|nr:hypothetical protein [Calothrix sp. SM1_5_4]